MHRDNAPTAGTLRVFRAFPGIQRFPVAQPFHPQPPLTQAVRLAITMPIATNMQRLWLECCIHISPNESSLKESNRIKYLRITRWIFGLIFVLGIWPPGWLWHTEGRSYYLEMIMGMYATLGIFLILVARDPLKNLSLIWFTVWSSGAHGGIMAVQSFHGIRKTGVGK